MPAKIIFSSEEQQEIFNLYVDGKSTYTIAKIKNCNSNTILKLLKNNNIQIRERQETSRKHWVDQSYFDKIDREDKAYFLGFLFADGNVSISSNRTTLKLNIKDKNILELFSTFIYKEDLSRQLPPSYSYLEINSKKIKNKLIDYGCTPKKSLTLQFPQNIPENMIHHFMRGYFDGDGCISISEIKNKNSSSLEGSVAVISTKEFCQTYGNYIHKYCNFEPSYRQQKESLARGNTITTYLKVGGNKKILKLYHFLYQDATIFLERKKQKFETLKKQSEQRDVKQRPIDLTQGQIDAIVKLYKSGFTAKQIGKNYQYSSSSILRILKNIIILSIFPYNNSLFYQRTLS